MLHLNCKDNRLYYKLAGFARTLLNKYVFIDQKKKRTGEDVFLKDLLDNLMIDPVLRERVDRILTVGNEDPRLHVLPRDERALPGDESFKRSGWWKYMLTRYALATYHSKGKCVLDSCSGLGWGSYLVDAVADLVLAVDIDKPTVELARSLWPTRVTEWIQGSVLELGFASNSIDVGLAMEGIEHFTLVNIHRYLDEIYRVIRPGGELIGSSSFPETREQADALCAENPYHLYICTRGELISMLEKRFSLYYIYQNGLFFWAQK
jgi:ubiquinone/menaquinone biosynthesis C-methylase UbiE